MLITPKISACLVIYNEGVDLERCLKSIKDVVNEIIIVHDGECKDKSLEIAKKYNAKIFIQPHIGEAEYHRPFAFEKATGDWILHIDADEYFEKISIERIRKLTLVGNIDCYSFLWPYKKNKDEFFTRGVFYSQFRPCLFRKSKLYMLGITHQHPGTYGRIVKDPTIIIKHDHSPLSFKVFIEKKLKWSKLQAIQTRNYLLAPKYNISENSAVLSKFKNINQYLVLYCITDLTHEILSHLKRGLLVSGLSAYNIALVSYFRILSFYYYLIFTKNE